MILRYFVNNLLCRFDPERFCEGAETSRPSFSYEPFGFAGKRKCPGYRFSLSEATILLAFLLRSFKFSLAPGQIVAPSFGLVTRALDEIWITIKPLH